MAAWKFTGLDLMAVAGTPGESSGVVLGHMPAVGVSGNAACSA
jgi:hypothetical protein